MNEYMKKVSFIFLPITAAVMIAAVYFTSFTYAFSKENKNNPAVDWQLKRLTLYESSVYPKAVAAIKTGDMITRLGIDITSEMIRQLNQHDQSFSHCGIASIEQDTVFIYHAIGGEFNPNQKLKREPLYSFCHPSENKAIGLFEIAMAPETSKKLITIVQETYKKGTPFDMNFDYSTDDKLYCAEFVSKSFSRAMKDSSWFSFSRKDNFQYVAIDNLFSNKRMHEKMRIAY